MSSSSKQKLLIRYLLWFGVKNDAALNFNEVTNEYTFEGDPNVYRIKGLDSDQNELEFLETHMGIKVKSVHDARQFLREVFDVTDEYYFEAE